MPRRLLAIDGGGIRGLIPALALSGLEALAQRSCGEIFDLVAGTSTGGIIACGVVEGIPAEQIAKLYTQHGAQIFKRRWSTYFGLSGPRYGHKYLRGLLGELFSAGRLGDHGRPCEIVVPSFSLKPYGPYYFKSWQARGEPRFLDPGERWQDFDYSLVDVALATSSAPTYFPAAAVTSTSGRKTYMIDGGVHANNPVLAAAISAEQLWPGEEREILSLGTGQRVHPIDGKDAQGWGLAEWAPHIVNVCMDGSASDSEYWADLLARTCITRIQPTLPPEATALDDASAENLARLTLIGRRDYSAELERFC